MLEEFSGDQGHTCLSHRTATCRFMHESASIIETELPIVNAAEEQMKVIRKRSEEISVTNFGDRRKKMLLSSQIMHEKQLNGLH